MSHAALWPYALAIYGRPGVEAALLEAQDAHGQSVPYLIWALWLADSGRPCGPETLAAGARLARAWEAAATAPLRDLRRRLKALPPPISPAARDGLRERVRAVELEGERLLLEMLEETSPAPCGPAVDAQSCLADAAQAWDQDARPELIVRLAALTR